MYAPAVRRGGATAVVAALVALLAPAAGGARRHLTCDRLQGYDLAPARDVKLVERPNHRHGVNLVGCVLPHGRTIQVDTRYRDRYHLSDYVVKGIRGHIVRDYGKSWMKGQPGRATQMRVVDLERRRWYSIASFCSLRICNLNIPQYQLARRAYITADGQAAAAIENTKARRIAIKVFSRDGVERVLDHGSRHAIHPASLVLRGRVVRWRHSGERKRATLSG